MSEPGASTDDPPPMVPLTITAATDRGRATLRPVGEVDPSTVDLLQEAIHSAAGSGVDLIEVDCAELRFLDSAGVNVLANAQRSHEVGSGPKLVLTNATGIVARVLEVSGVADRLMR